MYDEEMVKRKQVYNIVQETKGIYSFRCLHLLIYLYSFEMYLGMYFVFVNYFRQYQGFLSMLVLKQMCRGFPWIHRWEHCNCKLWKN